MGGDDCDGVARMMTTNDSSDISQISQTVESCGGENLISFPGTLWSDDDGDNGDVNDDFSKDSDNDNDDYDDCDREILFHMKWGQSWWPQCPNCSIDKVPNTRI